MRVIKFRVWNCHGKVMHHWGELVDNNKIHLLANQQSSYPVMQFTGLHDKNGVEIYENDIIECWGLNFKIIWNESYASFFADCPDAGIYESGQEWGGSCVVIGNIHETPELFK